MCLSNYNVNYSRKKPKKALQTKLKGFLLIDII